MVQVIKSFSGSVVVDVVSRHAKEDRQWWPAALLDTLVARFGRLVTDDEVEAAWDLIDEEDRLQAEAIHAQEEAMYDSYRWMGTAD